MKKTFSWEAVTITHNGKKKNIMVFTAFDESKQKFVQMVLEPKSMTTKDNGLKIIEGTINEITKYE